VRDLVLVDSQPARIRVFREAIVVFQGRFKDLAKRSAAARAESVKQVDRAQRTAEGLEDFAAAKAARRQQRLEEEGVRLHVFPSGPEALKFLRREPPYEWAPRPAVVFTELYVGGRVGLVEMLKADPELQDVPTVVLCSGATPHQVREAWEAGSNAVVNLPPELPGMLNRVADTLDFWLREAAV
jgi:CheY-like chemotaxis protein